MEHLLVIWMKQQLRLGVLVVLLILFAGNEVKGQDTIPGAKELKTTMMLSLGVGVYPEGLAKYFPPSFSLEINGVGSSSVTRDLGINQIRSYLIRNRPWGFNIVRTKWVVKNRYYTTSARIYHNSDSTSLVTIGVQILDGEHFIRAMEISLFVGKAGPASSGLFEDEDFYKGLTPITKPISPLKPINITSSDLLSYNKNRDQFKALKKKREQRLPIIQQELNAGFRRTFERMELLATYPFPQDKFQSNSDVNYFSEGLKFTSKMIRKTRKNGRYLRKHKARILRLQRSMDRFMEKYNVFDPQGNTTLPEQSTHASLAPSFIPFPLSPAPTSNAMGYVAIVESDQGYTVKWTPPWWTEKEIIRAGNKYLFGDPTTPTWSFLEDNIYRIDLFEGRDIRATIFELEVGNETFGKLMENDNALYPQLQQATPLLEPQIDGLCKNSTARQLKQLRLKIIPLFPDRP